ncbi:unnamed protein product (mitochondrion) [Plasmodiophora brassicae]|uniref:Uncharacterized protein n=1 Tax=Plasmodiophora brassicae TaxID=37360 RepID=A0A3P3YJE8_PLABS|nr:unnamed protein product [Plasmodiophora brassicae]
MARRLDVFEARIRLRTQAAMSLQGRTIFAMAFVGLGADQLKFDGGTRQRYRKGIRTSAHRFIAFPRHERRLDIVVVIVVDELKVVQKGAVHDHATFEWYAWRPMSIF